MTERSELCVYGMAECHSLQVDWVCVNSIERMSYWESHSTEQTLETLENEDLSLKTTNASFVI